jgi:hypothetical protein
VEIKARLNKAGHPGRIHGRYVCGTLKDGENLDMFISPLMTLARAQRNAQGIVTPLFGCCEGE